MPHFGLIVATCERGDLRLSPEGVLVHGIDGTREVAVPRGPGRPGQGDALDALWDAVREGRPASTTRDGVGTPLRSFWRFCDRPKHRKEIVLTRVPRLVPASGTASASRLTAYGVTLR